jgi:cell division protein FtsN
VASNGKRKGSQAVRAGSPPLPAWVWLVAGFALGVLVSAIWIFRDWRSDPLGGGARPNPDAQAQPVSDAGIAAAGQGDSGASTSAPAEPTRPKFDFYTVLKEREVVIPDEELRAQSQAPEVKEEPNTRYWLQVGSFPKPEDADSLKARLALMGVKVQIAPVTINGTTWHRVRTGPYANAKDLEEAKRALQADNVEAFAYKDKLD